MAPNSLSDILSNTSLSQSNRSGEEFLRDLLNANEAIIISLLKAYESADKVTELGVANFLQDRIDIHQKHGWMLKATLK
jgi:DNA-binding ferritin-like protein